MRKSLLFLLVLLLLYTNLQAQYKNPVLQAHFGVDAELTSSYLYDFVFPGDDWFSDGTTIPVYNAGTYIIDTTGAAAMAARFAIDPAFRKLPFFRPMRFPAYSVVNSKLLIDGVFIRDYHNQDSTVFAGGGNKNGMSPANWNAPVEQSVPDKDDIEDMFVHVRRGGPSSSDDLWLFGGVTIIGTTGNRYFDFEMYQTDIYYDRLNRKFIGYGPDEGHTSWTFDAQGKVLKPGDIIFTAEYSTASITSLQARIWVNKNVLSITPAAFNWAKDASGNLIYDGAANNSQYVYAAITPKTDVDFYTGVQSKTGTWAGPYKFIDAGNNVHDTFTGGEFMEFSVNLTILGLDPVTLLGGSACGLPFRRVLTKTRASTSFTAALKDFVGPFTFTLSEPVNAAAEAPILCTTDGISKINVLNPYETSIYTWYTEDGNIIDGTNPRSIYVNSPGTYIVKQQLLDGCGTYALDTVQIIYDPNCVILDSKDIRLSGTLKEGKPLLSWSSVINSNTKYYEVQRSIDGGKTFVTIDVVKNSEPGSAQKAYSYRDESVPQDAIQVYYRIRAVLTDGAFISTPVLIRLPYSLKLSVYPNPAYQKVNLSIFSEKPQKVEVAIVSAAGKIVYQESLSLKKGENLFTLDRVSAWTPGMYIVRVSSITSVKWEKIVLQSNNL